MQNLSLFHYEWKETLSIIVNVNKRVTSTAITKRYGHHWGRVQSRSHKMEAQKWNGNDQHVRLKTLVETLDHAIPQFYPVVYVVPVTLLTYPVSTCTAERSFCADDEAEISSLKYHE